MRVGVVQINVQDDKEANVRKAHGFAREAAASADLVVLPENLSYLGPDDGKLAAAEPIPGPTIQGFQEIARSSDAWIVCGSIPELSDEEERVYNTSVLVGPDGRIHASYRKIHLFDVDLSADMVYRESDHVKPGDRPVTAEIPGFGTLGMSICYDLRFPELYRRLADAGAKVITVPAAFTLETGKDHWETLLRARAIENQAYVVAAGVMGSYPPNRRTYGRSLVVDPWGVVVAKASDVEGVIFTDLRPEVIDDVRRKVPALRHRVPALAS
ncbi:MAG TPA: carbon-nitrogen hydrolase family protein [Trueperaceae bacterium]|nr:carbon-nitrogen hydrolase family protein [Trueperaceae bacterium]